MKPQDLHPWHVPVEQAMGIQEELAEEVALENDFDDVEYVAGADIAVDKARGMGFAAVVLYTFPSLVPQETAVAKGKLTFPYMPGLLSFREGPLLLEALCRLRREPDLIFFDGQGVAHPRRLGVASHLGLVLDKPTIGCAKSRLVGEHGEPGPAEGDASELVYHGRLVGHALRSKPKTQPIFVSPGHRIDYTTALKLVKGCLDGFRIPKPTRQADGLAEAFKKGRAKEFEKKLK